ncbi:MAG: ABC transporter ATP-binding protein [Hyphomicrobiaceae bacterium]
MIRLVDVSKVYTLGETPLGRLRKALGLAPGSQRTQHRAVDGVSLSIAPGETVGILGVNGAGKSTLLQMITGTLKPTAGTVEVGGRIAALLELGAGFNPQWTGRKNAEFQCVLQGVPAADIPARLEAIEAFADIGAYFDQPASTYSSGMFVRVAFASSVASKPDILIVDEALAVGDVKFQNKCFRRFEDLQNSGCTILFVTHSTELVTRFCTRCVVMHLGRVHFDGTARDGVTAYNHLLYPVQAAAPQDIEVVNDPKGRPAQVERGGEAVDEAIPAPDCALEAYQLYNQQETRTGNGLGRIVAAVLRAEDGSTISTSIKSGDTVTLVMALDVCGPVAGPDVGFTVRDGRNQALFGSSTLQRKQVGNPLSGGSSFTVAWTFKVPLFSGSYFIDLGFADAASGIQTPLDWRIAAIHFTVESPLDCYGLIYTPIRFAGLPDTIGRLQ